MVFARWSAAMDLTLFLSVYHLPADVAGFLFWLPPCRSPFSWALHWPHGAERRRCRVGHAFRSCRRSLCMVSGLLVGCAVAMWRPTGDADPADRGSPRTLLGARNLVQVVFRRGVGRPDSNRYGRTRRTLWCPLIVFTGRRSLMVCGSDRRVRRLVGKPRAPAELTGVWQRSSSRRRSRAPRALDQRVNAPPLAFRTALSASATRREWASPRRVAFPGPKPSAWYRPAERPSSRRAPRCVKSQTDCHSFGRASPTGHSRHSSGSCRLRGREGSGAAQPGRRLQTLPPPDRPSGVETVGAGARVQQQLRHLRTTADSPIKRPPSAGHFDSGVGAGGEHLLHDLDRCGRGIEVRHAEPEQRIPVPMSGIQIADSRNEAFHEFGVMSSHAWVSRRSAGFVNVESPSTNRLTR